MLSSFQEQILDLITRQVDDLRRRYHQGEAVYKEVQSLACYAYGLYLDMAAAGRPPEFGKNLLRNRGVPPTDPEFFRNFDAVDALTGLVRGAEFWADEPPPPNIE